MVTHPKNRGYGGALRSGFAHATKDLVFYTDGDAQYDPRELALLLAALTPERRHGQRLQDRSATIRSHRIIIGRVYHHVVKTMFRLRMRDVDCDFRLLRRSMFDQVELRCDSGVICVELMTKVHQAGFRIAEVPVHHFHRAYGQSQFFNFRRVARVVRDLLRLWWQLICRDEFRRGLATRRRPLASSDRPAATSGLSAAVGQQSSSPS